MVFLTAEGLSKQVPDKILFEKVRLSIHEGDKIGLIGINGTGKSTLLQVLAGLEPPDEGEVVTARGLRIGYLPQNPVFQEGLTILDQVLLGLQGQEREAAAYECSTILNRMGITDTTREVTTLSGGQKKRVALASTLVHPVDLLILDEPTNHLDSETIAWLEGTLARRKGALLMVTHDRYFLERVANCIVELRDGQLFTYPSNYSRYLELKAQQEEMLSATQRKRQSVLRKELAWMQRGARARSTKAKGRIQRYEALQEETQKAQQALEQPHALQGDALSNTNIGSRLGKKIVELDHLNYSIPGQVLLKDFSYHLLRDDRVGILGPNGVGKSTFLKILSGELPPDSGTVSIGETVKLGIFGQEFAPMDPNQKVIDYIRDIAPSVQTPQGTQSASQMLELFLFSSTLQYTAIGRLSGGEKRRLYLLGVLMSAPNVLLLDEPTNDLDLQTLTLLEDYLDTFQGAVVAVSHDRYFLDRVAKHLFVFEGNGVITPYLGGYSDYLEERKPAAQQAAPSTPKEHPSPAQRSKPPKRKFSYQEQRDYEQIDGIIAQLEQSLAQKEEEIAGAASDYTRLQQLLEEKSQLEQELEAKMERWVYLNELAEQLGQ